MRKALFVLAFAVALCVAPGALAPAQQEDAEQHHVGVGLRVLVE